MKALYSLAIVAVSLTAVPTASAVVAVAPQNPSIELPVEYAGSDEASKAFQENVMPGLLDSVKETIDGKGIKDLSAAGLDPFRLTLANDSSVRLYFLGEKASTSNTLGFSTTGGSPLSEDAQIIFPNASSSQGNTDDKSSVRSDKYPLLIGDFVDLGEYKAGTMLDFFLISNGYKNGKLKFVSTNTALNKDGMVSAVSLAKTGSSYAVVSFEDSPTGADQDYDDLFFALEFSNTGSMDTTGTPSITGGSVGAPEPSLAAGAVLAALGFGLHRRRKQA